MSVKIAVIGLGKIGLPLAVQFASKGYVVTGVDINARVVDLVNRGVEPFPGEKYLQERLRDLVPKGLLRATDEFHLAIPDADAVVVVVPLFVDKNDLPDFTWMDSATEGIAENLRPGTLISYETTLPVGTTRGRWKPMIEKISSLKEGEDFHLVFSPERVLTGRVIDDLRRFPKIVGGLSEQGTKKAVEFYESVLDFDERPDLAKGNGVWDIGSAEAAEFSKLAETTYRDVNIGLANQFARFADRAGIDIYSVIEAANSQPVSHIHRPGIAVGGHCIPVYPRLYLWNDPEATIVKAARVANKGMPDYSVGLLEEMHGSLEGERVAVLGASYRGKVKETAFSGVFETVAALESRGANVYVHDPMYSDHELMRLGFSPYHFGEPIDAAILQADHPEYSYLSPTEMPGIKSFMDGRKIIDPEHWQGVNYRAIGIGKQ